jgi:hypothetical protein
MCSAPIPGQYEDFRHYPDTIMRRNMSNTRIIAYVLAAAGVLFIGSQASLRFGGSEATAQQGGPAVTVVNTPLPVTVTNPTIPPSTVNVGNPAALAAANAQVFKGTPVAFNVCPVAGKGCGSSTFSVPVGQRLVIEYVSGACGPTTLPQLTATTNGVGNTYLINMWARVLTKQISLTTC